MLGFGILLISIISDLLLGVLVYKANPRSKTNQIFGALIGVTILWLIATYLSGVPGQYFADSPYASTVALVFVRVAMVFATLQIFFIFLLAHTFPEERLRLSPTLVKIFSGYIVFTCLVAISPFMFVGLKTLSPINPLPGPGIVTFMPVVIGFFGGSIFLLIRKTLKATGILRKQLATLTAGIIVTFGLIALSNFILLLAFNNPSLIFLTPTFTLVLAGALTYSITSYGLFNVKVILVEIAAVTLVLVNVFQVFYAENLSQLLSRGLILALVTLFSYLFVRSVQNEVRRREEVEKLAKEKTAALTELEQRNRNLATLQKISDVVLNESDMRVMLQKILNGLPDQLEACAGGLLSIVRNGQLMAFAMTRTPATKKVEAYIGDLDQYSHTIAKGFNRLHDVLITKKVMDSDSLADFISPPISKSVALGIQKSLGARHFEAFPLYAGKEPFGVMLFVFTESKELSHTKNLSIARSVADDMSLAIQRAQAFDKLKEANEYLAELDKLKDEFISMASHELNTPLAAIEGYLSMVLDEGMGKVDPKAKEYLSRAYASSKRLADLILDLLNVSRIEQGRLKMKFALTSLVDLAESVIKELQIKADSKKLYLKLDANAKTLPEIWCDPDRIREVFVNLTGNAIKFTERGGITIKVSKIDQRIRAEIVDTGRGVAEDDKKKLFQKFSQVKREIDEHQGTGLGLYISKNFVELHKGRIWVESVEGKGSTFAFELPIVEHPPEEVKGAILESPISSSSAVASKAVPIPPKVPGT